MLVCTTNQIRLTQSFVLITLIMSPFTQKHTGHYADKIQTTESCFMEHCWMRKTDCYWWQSTDTHCTHIRTYENSQPGIGYNIHIYTFQCRANTGGLSFFLSETDGKQSYLLLPRTDSSLNADCSADTLYKCSFFVTSRTPCITPHDLHHLVLELFKLGVSNVYPGMKKSLLVCA